MGTLKRTIYGVLARILNVFFPIKKNMWVFGSDYGNTYREGSKYLIEYMNKKHSEYNCVFITKSPEVITELKELGIECCLNTSFKGLYYTAIAECVFTCQYLNDIDYTFKKKGRRYFYLLHGMAYKLAMNSLPERMKSNFRYNKESIITKIRALMAQYFVQGYDMNDVEFISSTSDFLSTYIKLDFTPETDVRVLGMPRNDALFDSEGMGKRPWLKETEGKFVVSYMPTHRNYGNGDISPMLFYNNEAIKQWLREHNVVVLIKQHPNMIAKMGEFKSDDVVIDITKNRLDPQLCIYHSDVLITDYSSVWIDYLLLKRPILFYYYDDFESEDAGTHYSIEDKNVGTICRTEQDLFNSIVKIIEDYHRMCPSEESIKLFHTNADGCSCERYFNEITLNK